MRIKELVKFISERHKIYLKRKRGLPKPWTQDKILQTFRFTNAYRELDVVTKWIAGNWRTPHADDPHLWFAMVVARFLNFPGALDAIGYPLPWTVATRGRRRRKLKTRYKNYKTVFTNKAYQVSGGFLSGRKTWVHDTLKQRKAEGAQNFSGAYMVRSDPCCKIDYVVYVWDKMWNDRERIEALIQKPGVLLAEVHELLESYYGMGSFMAGQVIADLKYEGPLRLAPDWKTFAASGPGSRRGLNRLLGEPIASPWKEAAWLAALKTLHAAITPLCKKNGLPVPHAQDLQGWLCEFDKYERTRLGEGRPRSLYPGSLIWSTLTT